MKKKKMFVLINLYIGWTRFRKISKKKGKKTSTFAEQMNFIDDDERNGSDVVSGLPGSTDSVPLLRGGDDDVGAGDGAHVRRHIARQLHHVETQSSVQTILPVVHPLAHQGFHGRDVHHLALGVLAEHAEHGYFSHYRFPLSNN